MNLNATADLIYRILANHPHSRIVDDTDESPGVCIVADYLIGVVLPRSVRTRLSPAEACFLMRALKGGYVDWPATLDGLETFLAELSSYLRGVPVSAMVQRLWSSGFLFFGTSDTVKLALDQLGATSHAYMCDMVLTAGNLYFNGKPSPRTFRHLTYNVRDGGVWFPLNFASVSRRKGALVLCVYPSLSISLRALRETLRPPK